MNNPSPTLAAQPAAPQISTDVEAAFFPPPPAALPPIPDLEALLAASGNVTAFIRSLSIIGLDNGRAPHPALTGKQRSARTWAVEAETYLDAAIVEIKADAAQREGNAQS